MGQFIAKKFRGKDYGTKGLALTLEYGRSIIPEDEFYLRVNKDNAASLKIMLNNGGRIVSENEEKYFVRIKK
ncbi:MAG: GNAT family N-acetyltransferase [Treponema sp.]|nr:GNAT family N-acetyltransferase [Candidatus Treponema caballi]